MGWILTVVMLDASIRFRIVSITRRRVFIWVVGLADMAKGRGVAHGLGPRAGRIMGEDAGATRRNVIS